jgi:two-component system sensor histidine kinase PilS (NtrC family)
MILLADRFNLAPTFLSVGHPKLFIVSAYGYFIFALFAFYLTWQHNPLDKTFSHLGPILDLLFVSVLMQSSGGVTHGMGVLFIIVVIAQALLNPGYWAIATTFLGCVLLIGLQLYDWILYPSARTSLLPTVALGLTCISSALIAGRLVKRVESQSLALSTAEQLNSLIVSLMPQGVVIVDQLNQTKLINQKAKQVLNLSSSPKSLKNFPKGFQLALSQELETQIPYRLEIQPWGPAENQTGKIIFLYDLIEEKKRAQTLKLASLGQLAANIAHEIRNPLSAITQSAELLKEFNQESKHDRLFQILLDNSKRINTVIQNVLSLSTRALPHTEQLDLIPWLDNLTDDLYFSYTNKLKIEKIYALTPIKIHCDASQLRQVILNLCENGIRYSLQKNPIATLKIQVTSSKDTLKNLIHIDIIDNGKGVSEESIKHLFEPFYTTEKNGSGLGLFVAKELLEMNGGQLSFSKNYPTGCQFRVTLYEN